ncbi:MAG: hypothetical protein RI955_911 [Bacteroidota bacterium]|jgi:outer membrane protein W
MKKTFLLIAFLSIAFFNKLNAQGFEEGKMYISAGFGGPYLASIVSTAVLTSSSNVNTTTIFPMYLKGEVAISDNVGVGLNIAFAGLNLTGTHINSSSNNPLNSNYTDNAKYRTVSGLLRFNYHFIKAQKFDPYFGVGFGYRWGQWTYSSTDPTYDFGASKTYFPFGMDMTLGCRYMFSDNIGAYVEMGIAKSPFQFGATFRF